MIIVLLINNYIVILLLLDHSFPSRILKYCNILSRFFKTSHQGGNLLNEYINEMNIKGGGLKKYCETRWTSSYETVSSVARLQEPLEKVLLISN